MASAEQIDLARNIRIDGSARIVVVEAPAAIWECHIDAAHAVDRKGVEEEQILITHPASHDEIPPLAEGLFEQDAEVPCFPSRTIPILGDSRRSRYIQKLTRFKSRQPRLATVLSILLHDRAHAQCRGGREIPVRAHITRIALRFRPGAEVAAFFRHADESSAHGFPIEQRSTQIARDYDVIRVEDLDVRNMTRSAKGTVERPGRNVRQKAGLNRAILASGWGMFAARLEHKAAGRLEKVNPAFTSWRCSECGTVDRKARESQAVFRCRSCGYSANADLNAARNIAAGHAARGGRGLPRPSNREPQLPTFHVA